MSKKIFLILILSFFFLVTCENENQNENIQTQFDLEKMKIKELRRLLEERGVDCIGCSEKAHLIEKVRESLHLPILSNDEKEKEINEQTKSEDKEPPKTLSQMELKEILKNLENEKNKKREVNKIIVLVFSFLNLILPFSFSKKKNKLIFSLEKG